MMNFRTYRAHLAGELDFIQHLPALFAAAGLTSALSSALHQPSDAYALEDASD